MHLLRQSHHQVAWVVGRIGYPAYSATFVVKGTYRLRPGQPAEAVADQPELSPDVYVDDDLAGPLHYPSDYVYYKPKADIAVVGHVYAPEGTPVGAAEATVTVGRFSKTLFAFGDRFWTGRGIGAAATPPQAFTRMEISYANAFGGTGFTSNPAGKGFASIRTRDGQRQWPLPNIERPDDLVSSSASAPWPAGFGPLSQMWAQRLAKCGTYDDNWLRNRWPWFPEDLDWSFFNSSPPDQQVEGFLRGDEPMRLTNLHPEQAIFDTYLPNIRPRCFYAAVVGAPLFFREVPLHLDTLWVDADAGTMVLLWRGAMTLRGDNLGKQDRLLVASEWLVDDPMPLEHYEAMCVRLMDASADDEQESKEDATPVAKGTALGPPLAEVLSGAILPEVDLFEAHAALAASEPAPVSRDWCLAHYSNGGSFAHCDLTGVDLCDASMPGACFQDAILVDAFLRRADFVGADFSGAVLAGVDLTDANLCAASMINTDLTHARLVRCNLERATLTDADLTGAALRGAQMAGVTAARATMTGANLHEVTLTGADLTAADLSRSRLHMAVLTGAVMRDASIEGASAFPLIADGADLTGLRATGAILWESSFRHVHAASSIWQGAELRDSDFSGADLSGAEFEEAGLQRADFTCAILRHARFMRADVRDARMINCDLLGASLERADMTGALLAHANLFAAEVLETQLQGADLRQADVGRTALSRP